MDSQFINGAVPVRVTIHHSVPLRTITDYYGLLRNNHNSFFSLYKYGSAFTHPCSCNIKVKVF
jgi:hypothetical protein